MSFAISKSETWLHVAFDHLRSRIGETLSAAKSRRLLQASITASVAELSALSDRDLADIGYRRSTIREVVAAELAKDALHAQS